MLHRLVMPLAIPDNNQFSGLVEIDESYVSDDDKNKHENKKTGKGGRNNTVKTSVLGMKDRSIGTVKAHVIKNTRSETMLSLM